jgi:hypothetical protein
MTRHFRLQIKFKFLTDVLDTHYTNVTCQVSIIHQLPGHKNIPHHHYDCLIYQNQVLIKGGYF